MTEKMFYILGIAVRGNGFPVDLNENDPATMEAIYSLELRGDIFVYHSEPYVSIQVQEKGVNAFWRELERQRDSAEKKAEKSADQKNEKQRSLRDAAINALFAVAVSLLTLAVEHYEAIIQFISGLFS